MDIVAVFLINRRSRSVWVSPRLEGSGDFCSYLQPPGGKVELTDESLAHAAIREVLEETGISLPLDSLVKLHYATDTEHPKGPLHVSHFYAETDLVPQRVEPVKAGDWMAVPFSELRQAHLMPNSAKAAPYLLAAYMIENF